MSMGLSINQFGEGIDSFSTNSEIVVNKYNVSEVTPVSKAIGISAVSVYTATSRLSWAL